MATWTPNLNLYKPDASDPFANFREEFNDNMDKLDNGGGDTVLYVQTITGGTELGKIYVNGSGKSIYAPTYSLRNVTMGDAPYLEFGSYSTGFTLVPTRDFSSLVSLANQRVSGDKVADLTIDGTTTTLYSKQYTGGEGVDVDASGNVSLEYLTVVDGAVNLVFDDGN